MNNVHRLLVLSFLLIQGLSGCGGGGGSGAPTNPGSGSGNNSDNGNQGNSNTGKFAFPGIPNEIVSQETLPRVDILTLGNTIIDEPKIQGRMRITEYFIGELPISDYQGAIGIEYRGSSSQYYYDKKNYGLETRDNEGNDLDVSLLGFPEEEDWVLHGPFGDKSLMRNTLMFDIADTFGRYRSQWRYLELYIDGEYMGLYVLLEKIKRDESRVDIATLKDTDNEGEELTGGYIIKLDKTNGEHDDPAAWNLYTANMSFTSEHGSGINSSFHHFIYHYPKSSKISEAQKTYIQNYVHAFEDALAGDMFKDEELGYRNYLDVDSFVDYFIATEISGNVDAFSLSTFLQKDKNGKLAMGPLWDFNLAFGNADYCFGWQYDVWLYRSEERCEGGDFATPFWWYRLLEDEYFVALVKARWQQLRNDALSDAALEIKITEKSTYLISSGAAERNFERWDVLGMYIWPNYNVGFTYEEEVEYLADWLTNRMAWLDVEIENL